MTDNTKNMEETSVKNTGSSHLSSDQLICKSPQGSPNSSVKSLRKVLVVGDDGALLCLGLLQFVFGFLMMVFGGLVIHYESSLAQLGGGIWGGCLSMSTGIIGILASARDWCPLRSTPQRITHTVFLALSLISLAIAQLVVALAATGAARDINSSEFEDDEVEVPNTTAAPGQISILLPYNYTSILSNLGLLAAAVGEFIVAAVASYKSSRILCPCFRRKQDRFHEANRNALVTSWLGKHSSAPQIYVVAPSSLGKGSKLPVPVFALPPPAPRPVGYPLIPAPLGSIPSPVIPPSPPVTGKGRRTKRKEARRPEPNPRRSRSKSVEKPVTEADVVRTYTGLDKAIAEEFIDICDSRNVSLASDSSCSSACERSCSACNEADGASEEYLVNKT